MRTNTPTNRKRKLKGFTLIEVIAVLVLLGILTAVAVPKYIDMATSAKLKAIDAAVAELNSREALTWGKEQMSGDTIGTTTVSTDLGTGYTLATNSTSGKVTSITFQGESKTVTFAAASSEGPGVYTSSN